MAAGRTINRSVAWLTATPLWEEREREASVGNTVGGCITIQILKHKYTNTQIQKNEYTAAPLCEERDGLLLLHTVGGCGSNGGKDVVGAPFLLCSRVSPSSRKNFEQHGWRWIKANTQIHSTAWVGG